MAKKWIRREEEVAMVAMLAKLVTDKVDPNVGIVNHPQGLVELQMSLANRIDEIHAYVELLIDDLKIVKGSAVTIKRLERLAQFIKEGNITLMYCARVMQKQHLEIRHLKDKLAALTPSA